MLFCFTSSHRTASFDLLERLERSLGEVTSALEGEALISGSVVLATCNRFEAYLDLDDAAIAEAFPERAEGLRSFVSLVGEAAGVDPAELNRGSEVYTADAVAQHLFAVSSGLESVVVGEGEIAGQVRRAYVAARKAGSVTRDLERLFQDASRTSRGVKNSTGLMTAGRSMVRLALDLAESRFAEWSGLRVLLVGTGRYAAASLAAVRDRGVTDVAVYSRTGRAHAFALAHDVEAVSAASLAEAVASADIVIACTVAPGIVLDASMLRGAVARRAGSSTPLLLIDLGLPRNVDPVAAELAGVELLDLERISIHAPLDELQATDHARSIVAGAAAEFAAKTAEREVEPALVALRQHVFGILEAEIERHSSHDDGAKIAAALRHLTGVLLHQPSVRARELAHDGDADSFIAGVAAVFGVVPDDAGTGVDTDSLPDATDASDEAPLSA